MKYCVFWNSYSFLKNTFIVYVGAYACACHSTRVEVRRQLVRVHSLSILPRIWGSNSSCQVCSKDPSPWPECFPLKSIPKLRYLKNNVFLMKMSWVSKKYKIGIQKPRMAKKLGQVWASQSKHNRNTLESWCSAILRTLEFCISQ